MITHTFLLALAMGMVASAPTPAPEANPAPVADPAPKPGLTPLVYTPPVAVSYNAFSSVQTHPAAPAGYTLVKNAPAAVVPAVYTVQAQPAPAVGYAVNYPYVVL